MNRNDYWKNYRARKKAEDPEFYAKQYRRKLELNPNHNKDKYRVAISKDPDEGKKRWQRRKDKAGIKAKAFWKNTLNLRAQLIAVAFEQAEEKVRVKLADRLLQLGDMLGAHYRSINRHSHVDPWLATYNSMEN